MPAGASGGMVTANPSGITSPARQSEVGYNPWQGCPSWVAMLRESARLCPNGDVRLIQKRLNGGVGREAIRIGAVVHEGLQGLIRRQTHVHILGAFNHQHPIVRTPEPNSEVRNDNTYGILKLTRLRFGRREDWAGPLRPFPKRHFQIERFAFSQNRQRNLLPGPGMVDEIAHQIGEDTHVVAIHGDDEVAIAFELR